jgi:hypothetical protein
MRITSLHLAAAMALAAASRAWGQAPPEKRALLDAPIVTVCDVLRAPLEYDGRLVKISGRLSGTDEGEWLVGERCPKALVTHGYVWPTGLWLTAPGYRGVLHLLDFKLGEDSARKFNRSYKRLWKRTPEQCMVSTLTGLFETRRDWSQFKRVYPNGTWAFTGFGHLGEAPGQLVIKSEDGVTVDPNCDSGRNPRASGN